MNADTQTSAPEVADTKVRGQIVVLLVEELSTRVGGGLHRTPMELDGLGVIVSHKKGEIPPEEELRRYLIGGQRKRLLIEIEPREGQGAGFDPHRAAINKFFREYEGARVGSRVQALALHEEPHGERDVVHPHCEYMHRSPVDGTLICGPPAEDDPVNGEHGSCFLSEGCEAPNFCPVMEHIQREEERRAREKRLLKAVRSFSRQESSDD